MISDPIQNREQWDKWLAELKRRKHVRQDAPAHPEQYPVIVATEDNWDQRYNTFYTSYDFVYLESFILHDDTLLGRLAARHAE
jgi:hypothetical protein